MKSVWRMPRRATGRGCGRVMSQFPSPVPVPRPRPPLAPSTALSQSALPRSDEIQFECEVSEDNESQKGFVSLWAGARGGLGSATSSRGLGALGLRASAALTARRIVHGSIRLRPRVNNLLWGCRPYMSDRDNRSLSTFRSTLDLL